MIVRMLGTDAEVEYPDIAPDAVKRLEARFPCPDWAVIYSEMEFEEEGGEEEPADRLVVCRRYGGILLQMAFIGVDEIAEMDGDGVDWIGDLAHDLSMTEAEIEAEVDEGEEA